MKSFLAIATLLAATGAQQLSGLNYGYQPGVYNAAPAQMYTAYAVGQPAPAPAQTYTTYAAAPSPLTVQKAGGNQYVVAPAAATYTNGASVLYATAQVEQHAPGAAAAYNPYNPYAIPNPKSIDGSAGGTNKVNTECPVGHQCVAESQCPPATIAELVWPFAKPAKAACGDDKDKVCCIGGPAVPATVVPAPAPISTGNSFGDLANHQLSGTVEIKDNSTLVIRKLSYDGKGPSTIFIVGKETTAPGEDKAIPVPHPAFPSPNAIRPFGDASIPILPQFSGVDVELTMPEGVHTGDLKWISVWCRQFHVDFGHVIFKQ